jgi:hypothetical protein
MFREAPERSGLVVPFSVAKAEETGEHICSSIRNKKTTQLAAG